MQDARNLPDVVVARLDGVSRYTAPATRTVGSVHAGDLVEIRYAHFELRDSSDNDDVIVDGYAATFNQPYDICGEFEERIAAGAFSKALAEQDDVRFLANHEGLALARTKSGTLTLTQDDIGLRTEAHLDPASPVVAGLLSAIRRGDVDEMSFAFQATRQEWNEDWTQRTIKEVRLFDVSAVTYPANPATVIKERNAAETAAEESAAPAGFSLALAAAQAEALRIR